MSDGISTQSRDQGYQPPRIEKLGTIAELTRGHTTAVPDSIAVGSLAVSDGRLKHQLAPVDTGLVLSRLLRLV